MISAMLLGLILILATGAGPAQGGAMRQSESDFARGVELQQRGDLEGARDAYLASLEAMPRRVEALSNLGVVFARLGQYEPAIERYKAALALEPGEHAVRLNLAIAYFQTIRFDLAQVELARVVAAQPADHRARLLYGLCLFQLGKVEESIREFEVVHGALPDDLGAAYALATAYISSDQAERAKPLVEGVFSRIESAEAHLIMGSFASANRNFKTAIEEFTQARQLNPKLPTLNSRLGSVYLMAGNRAEALKAFEAEIEINPRDYDANARLGTFYREDGRLEEAEVRLERALELRPGDSNVLYQMAQLAQAKGSTEEAVGLLERVVATAPDYTPAHVLLARLYYKLKRPADAERERAIIDRLNAEQQKKQPVAGQPPEAATTNPGGQGTGGDPAKP
jgi:tetratricopeptide (TPR) repeat protein